MREGTLRVAGAGYSGGNHLLDALPAADSGDLERDLTIVDLRAHQSTHSIGKPITHVDFPIDAVLSVVATLKNGATVEVGTVGSESFVESEAVLHSAVSSRTSFCQVEGRVGRMSLERFDQRMETSAVFARFMRHNVRAVLFSAQQFTVCNIKHSILQRSARWFAMTEDRVGRPQFTLMLEFLAIMLGAQPTVVSDAVAALQQTGAIEYNRGGAVTIVDRGTLDRVACECYDVCKASFAASLIR
jgi:CRP-like cAMP-binding protein